MRKYPVVIVEWDDAAGEPGWFHTPEVDAEPLRCISVGFLVAETEKAICIATTYTEKYDKIADYVTIPRGMIVSPIRKLRNA